MNAELHMNGHKITNVKTPTDNSDSATKQYVDNKMDKLYIFSASKTNVLKYLMEMMLRILLLKKI